MDVRVEVLPGNDESPFHGDHLGGLDDVLVGLIAFLIPLEHRACEKESDRKKEKKEPENPVELPASPIRSGKDHTTQMQDHQKRDGLGRPPVK